MATVTRTNKALKAVTGTCRWLARIGSDPTSPNVGLVSINGRRYLLGKAEDAYLLLAVDVDARGERGDYQLPADLSSCDCKDHLHRSHQRPDGKCKHQKAIAALLASQPKEPAPVEVEDDTVPCCWCGATGRLSNGYGPKCRHCGGTGRQQAL